MSRTRRIVLAAVTAALTLALASTPSLADGRGHGRGHSDRSHRHSDRDRYERHDRYDRHERAYPRHVYHDHYMDVRRYAPRYRYDYRPVYRERVFLVPQRIFVGDLFAYDPYFVDEVFYAPHGHYHAIYDFPVMTPYGMRYAPTAYCGDRLFVDAHFGGRYYDSPRIGLHLSF